MIVLIKSVRCEVVLVELFVKFAEILEKGRRSCIVGLKIISFELNCFIVVR